MFEIRIPLAPVIDAGVGPGGRRLVYLADSGTFEGRRLRGVVVPMSGGDYVLWRSDGVAVIDVRLCLRTHDGATVLMSYGGRLVVPAQERGYASDLDKPDDPAGADRYYFRTTPLFETGDDRYRWLNQIVSVGKGRTGEGGVIYEVFEVK